MNRRLNHSSIRCGTADDLNAVLELWSTSGAPTTVTDALQPLRVLLDADPQALLVADASGELVGSLIIAWNGWRGSLYRLTVRPDHRRRGLASRLVREGETRLRKRGAARLDAIVASDDAAAMSFWGAAGYERQLSRSRFVCNL
jgi:ribosomal protein S18 acetylase RimI-like enzyme